MSDLKSVRPYLRYGPFNDFFENLLFLNGPAGQKTEGLENSKLPDRWPRCSGISAAPWIREILNSDRDMILKSPSKSHFLAIFSVLKGETFFRMVLRRF